MLDEYDDLLWTINVAYWCCAISAAVLKIFVPSIDGLLRYGIRRRHNNNNNLQKTIPFLLRLFLGPYYGIPPRISWASFYAIAFTNSCVLSCYNHLHSRRQYQVIVMFALHVMRRFLEVLFLQKLSPKPYISLAHFVMGTSFYIFAPFTIFIHASTLPVKLSAVYLFLGAQTFQHLKHRALVNVKPPLVRRKYGIPSGSFDVACPHYSAEIFTYFLFWILAPSVPGVLMVAFVVLNLAHSAAQTRAWYHQTFRGRLKNGQFKYALLKYVF